MSRRHNYLPIKYKEETGNPKPEFKDDDLIYDATEKLVAEELHEKFSNYLVNTLHGKTIVDDDYLEWLEEKVNEIYG